ncbi:MAG: pilus assembly protein, partial [Devosia nanyangense]|nr:pilus assembly protein [Devosia nanyangense]
MMRALRRMIARLARSGDGAAAVEFALILPILLLLYIGSIEASQLIITDRRVTTVAGTLGD